eukprot:gnl/MRDRNA2_/MRDRNA2_83246_c0_seq2.p1 gnl/MRDRNA2_/MRDRNA2_83246_c0~~gnl/MRDRNA2_/MRDRNA2_83246_c0_seq2.p1  ORF type:complete len:254 (+),score=46.64 gnl/MRDRNA2_/MRDRNA2_83246_c0_seq2:77-838(+)
MRQWVHLVVLRFLWPVTPAHSRQRSAKKWNLQPHGIQHVTEKTFNASVWASGKHTVLVFFYTASQWCEEKHMNRCEVMFEFYKGMAQKLNYTEVGFLMMECIDIEGDMLFFGICEEHVETVKHFPNIKYFNDETGLQGEQFPGYKSGWLHLPQWVDVKEMIAAVKEDILRTPRPECDIYSKDHCSDEEKRLIKYFKPKSDTVINTKIQLLKMEREKRFINQSAAFERWKNRDVEKIKAIDEKIKMIKMSKMIK